MQNFEKIFKLVSKKICKQIYMQTDRHTNDNKPEDRYFH